MLMIEARLEACDVRFAQIRVQQNQGMAGRLIVERSAQRALLGLLNHGEDLVEAVAKLLEALPKDRAMIREVDAVKQEVFLVTGERY